MALDFGVACCVALYSQDFVTMDGGERLVIMESGYGVVLGAFLFSL